MGREVVETRCGQHQIFVASAQATASKRSGPKPLPGRKILTGILLASVSWGM